MDVKIEQCPAKVMLKVVFNEACVLKARISLRVVRGCEQTAPDSLGEEACRMSCWVMVANCLKEESVLVACVDTWEFHIS